MSTLVEAERVGVVMNQLIVELTASDASGVPGTRLDGALAVFERLLAEGLAVGDTVSPTEG